MIRFRLFLAVLLGVLFGVPSEVVHASTYTYDSGRAIAHSDVDAGPGALASPSRLEGDIDVGMDASTARALATAVLVMAAEE